MPTTRHSPEVVLESLLNQLEEILGAERTALTQVDLSGLDQAVSDKLELQQALSAGVAAAHDGTAIRERLERIRSDIVRNQMLLVHARETVRGVLDLITGSPWQSYGPTGTYGVGRSAGLDTRG